MNGASTRAGGFTLLEVLIALSLLGMLMSLVYTGMYTGMRSWTAVEQRSTAAVADRTVRNWLRHQVGGLVPVEWNDNQKKRVAFSGDERGFRFFGFLEHPTRGGGVYLVSLGRHAVDETLALRLSYQLRGDGASALAGVGPVEVRDMGGPFSKVRFEYFGAPDENGPQRWRKQWPRRAERYPALVRVSAGLPGGRAWPDLVMPLRSNPDGVTL